MPVDALGQAIGLPMSVIFGFLLVLARLGGVFALVPIPMLGGAPAQVRLILTLVLTIALYPFWPVGVTPDPGMGQIAMWILREATVGLIIGLVVRLLTEVITLAAQMMSMQAGYSYATTIDPNSQADSGVLAVIGEIFASLLFFALGLHRRMIEAIAGSLMMLPPGGDWQLTALSSPEPLLALGGSLFRTSFTLALPVIALLLILDLTLAVFARINQQLQLLSVAFPAKMLLALVLIAGIAPAVAMVYESRATHVFSTLATLLSPAL